jgi:hypothetical protein
MRLRTSVLLILIGGGVWEQTTVIGASAGQTIAATAVDKAAVDQFDAAIAEYMALRERLREEIAGPVANSTAAKVTDASDALAGAIQRARPNAQIGALFVMPVTPVFKRRIEDAVRRENLGPVLAGIDDEDLKPVTPKIHLRFPVKEPLATMPPSLLAVLPPIPKALEYRIVGDYLVIRDVDAALILDFIPAAIKR